MLQSLLFTKTRKDAPKDEVSKNAELLIRAGFIYKEMAGVYSLLPLGVKTLSKITQIVREAMNTVSGQEVFLSALQEKSTWEKSNRWDNEVLDVWFKTTLKNGTELGLATTHEEPLTMIMKDHIHSYRDLPCYAYQFQTKFRNETRSKSGILRGREFLMKDLYSFSKNEQEHGAFYATMQEAYKNIFSTVGIGSHTYLTYASGGSFSKYSHEFQTVTDSGEDTIFICERCKVAVNKEIIEEQSVCPVCNTSTLVAKTSIEVGNIFNLGTRFSDALELTFLGEEGKVQPVIMGSYGIGIGRLMGTIVEVLSDEKGILWPQSISPFLVHLILIGENEEVRKKTNELYMGLRGQGIEVLFDDRDLRAGQKFADSDLIGIPYRIVCSEKTFAQGMVEVKTRSQDTAHMLPIDTIATRGAIDILQTL